VTALNEPGDAVPLPEGAQARVRGELGGVGLYKGGLRVGGLGIDDGGDNRLTIPTDAILGIQQEYRLTFDNFRRGKRLEILAHSAARNFLVPKANSAVTINLDGIRLPFGGSARRPGGPIPPVVVGVDGNFDPDYPLVDASTLASRFVPLTVNPPPGAPANSQAFTGSRPAAFPIIAGTDGFLTAAEVERILWQGARQANITRAAIRRPIGRAMQCWISVVDTAGEVLGVYRTPDATLFSYDVSVQKARTAVLFSDDQGAWSSRGLGQFCQRFYPAGQQQSPYTGPLYQLQDGITVGLLTGELGAPADGRFRNGITIFPGGVPIYRNGQLIGGVGVSGDGVDQDDITADAGSTGFGAPQGIRCDAMGPGAIRASLGRGLDRLEAAAPAGPPGPGLDFFMSRLARARTRLGNTALTVNPPFVKYPRHPGPVTVR
ncbi:MAG TPA: heme-binding protein, partial [Planctomycetota bacterium]|nr:heme-binding protein [Planctomycetota bacterium]